MRQLPLLCLLAVSALRAQDPFEIHVYEYEKLAPGQFTLEQHLNDWSSRRDQFHMTYELTAGLTSHVSLGFMQLGGVRPGGTGLEYAGWRVLPHFYLPEAWGLPFAAGLVAEFSFVRAAWSPDTRHLELRPILQRRFGPFEAIFNPVLSRTLHGEGTRDGWQLEPAARLAYGEKRLVPNLEYYPRQLFLGVDLQLRDNLVWSLGPGFGLSGREPSIVYKSRLEFTFGGK